ncbi:MAG: hypothetical protein AB1324_03940 [Candidatus Micrarchaeota archaeon]
MDEWIKSGPALAELLDSRTDMRRERRAGLAIVIPTYRNNAVLEKHLELLSKQTMKDFDIIIVEPKGGAPVGKPEWASILYLGEKGRNGPAGGFYTGELAALAEGYPMVVLSDDDAFPESVTLLEDLRRESESGADVVLPRIMYLPAEKSGVCRIVQHYGCLKRQVFSRAGLTFLPFFMGGEDVEFLERITKSGCSVRDIDAMVTHHKRPPFAITSGHEIYHYQRGLMALRVVRGQHYLAWRAFIYNMGMGAGFILAGRPGLGRDFLLAAWNASGFRLFHDPRGDFEGEPKPLPAGGWKPDLTLDYKSPLPVPEDFLDNATAGFLAGRLAWAWRYVSAMPYFFGKRILLIDRGKPLLDLPIMILARGTHVICEGARFEATPERGIARIAAGAILMAAIIPLIFFSATILLARAVALKSLLGIRSEGYGKNRVK